MNKIFRKLIEKPVKEISQQTKIDEHSKKIDLLTHTNFLILSAINRSDLTDIAINNNVSISELSKLDTNRPYQIFVKLFYSLIYPYLMAHNFYVYGRFLNILGVDSTFIKTKIKESGKYVRRNANERGLKLHLSAIVYPFTLPMEALLTPANQNDSPVFEKILNGIDPDLLKQCILTFDLGYFDLDRFKKLDERRIFFVTRIKSNVKYDIIREYAHSKIIKMSNGMQLRLVTFYEDGKKFEYLTNIFDLPDKYIQGIYEQRWNIEIFFRIMKKYLKIDHLISKSINGVLIQIFCALTAYLLLLVIQSSMIIYMTIPEIIRDLRHGGVVITKSI